MNEKYYDDLESASTTIIDFLNEYRESKILKDFAYQLIDSIVYANLIINFFRNLNRENVIECNLPYGKIGEIRKNFKHYHRNSKLALSASEKSDFITCKDYSDFKVNVENKYPEFTAIINYIEDEIDLKRNSKFLISQKKRIAKAGKKEANMHDELLTIMIEQFVKANKNLPNSSDIENLVKNVFKNFTKETLPEISDQIMERLHKDSRRMLRDERKITNQFNKRRYKTWKDSIDLFECMIKVSLESGQEQQQKLINKEDGKDNFKREALLKIHARALHISNEILVLLKAGYADGANARWRSLHELAVVAFFLLDQRDEVSKRYLEHTTIKAYKQAQDYRTCYKRLGYPPFDRKTYNQHKKEKEFLINKYGKGFNGEWGWIPESILKCRNFRELEKIVKLDHWYPFYSLSCDAVHAGSKGFYRLGLMDDYQDEVMLIGPTNYGLADVFQNASISLLHVSLCLLRLESDFDSIIQMQILGKYASELGVKASEIQLKIEKEEESLK